MEASGVEVVLTPMELVAIVFIGCLVTAALFLAIGGVAVLLRWVVSKRDFEEEPKNAD